MKNSLSASAESKQSLSLAFKKIWGMFILFVALFALNPLIKTRLNATGRMWLLLSIWVIVLSCQLIKRHHLPSRNKVMLAAILALVAGITDGIYNHTFGLVLSGITTFFAALAVFSVFEAYPGKLCILSKQSKKKLAISIFVTLFVGIILGYINYLLMRSNHSISFQPKIIYFFASFSPGIFEEIAFRALFLCLCISAANGKTFSRMESFTCWFMMVLPHVMAHTPDTFIYSGIISGFVSIIGLTLLFGLPFAIMQRKLDLTSAMVAHGLVDFIRFCLIGFAQ